MATDHESEGYSGLVEAIELLFRLVSLACTCISLFAYCYHREFTKGGENVCHAVDGGHNLWTTLNIDAVLEDAKAF